MQNYIDAKPKIQVNMLGEFSITINGNQFTNLKGRTKRVWMLIEYLIANRKKDVSMETLIEAFEGTNESVNPLNALKNLVYRARELLKDISHDDQAEFILFIRNTYTWNNDYPCIVDTEQLVDCWKLVNNSSQPDEIRIQACKEALVLYHGEFLPKSSYSTWVVSAAAYFATLYNECILNGCSILFMKQRFQEVIYLCESALICSPLEESFHKMLLYAYLGTDQRSKALSHYNDTIKLFDKELGVDISELLHPIYKQLVNSINRIEFDLDIINNDLKESYGMKGAYYCDYESFKDIYRIQARLMSRTGNSIFIVLFTLIDLNDETPEPKVAKLASGKLKEAILSSLRKGDTVAAYSSSQFIVMLPLVNSDNVKMATNRIVQKFQSLYCKNNVKLTTRINELDAAK